MMRVVLVVSLCALIASACSAEPEAELPPAPDADVTSTDSSTAETVAEIDEPTSCEGRPNGVDCDDGDPCTLEDRCNGGECTGGSNNPCETLEQCQVGMCVAGEGCRFDPLPEGSSCSVACFTKATCVAGKCEVDSKDYLQCGAPSEDEPCVAEILCEPTTGECTKKLARAVDASCDTDGDYCTLERCDAEMACVADDAVNTCEAEKQGEPCQVWVCQPQSGECKATGFAGEISCDDGNACTTTDTCTKDDFGFVTCKGTPAQVDDLNPCTDDACVNGVVTHIPIDGIVCDPQNPCSPTGLCEAGKCIPTQTCECQFDGDCPAPENKCLGTPFCNTTGVDNFCDIVPGSPVICEQTDLACFYTECKTTTGACVDVPVDNETPCEDGNPCTAFDMCVGGSCVGTQPVACDNGLFCDGSESCDPDWGCVPGAPPVVDDGIACTADSCNDILGKVVHTPDDAACPEALCQVGVCAPTGCALEIVPNCCGNGVVEAGEACDDGNDKPGDGCSKACEDEVGPADCKAVLDGAANAPTGIYLVDPDGPGGEDGYQVYCEMGMDGGGWTLVMVSSDDDQNTWTWTNRHLFDTDPTLIGNLDALTQDFKSSALHDVTVEEILFVHAPSGIWARYDVSADATGSLGELVASIGGPNDYPGPNDGYALQAGTITQQGNLCGLRLYFNVKDIDGSKDDHSWGPTWKVKNNEFCGFDDPGWRGSLGPHADLKKNNGVDAQNIEYDGLGFGWALGLNNAVQGTGGNHLKVYVRRK